MVRDNIKPDITMFINYEILNVNNVYIIRISIQKGAQRPYYLQKKDCVQKGCMFARELQVSLLL